MKRIPTLFGSVKCVFTLAILLLTTGSATAQNEVTLPGADWPARDRAHEFPPGTAR